MLAQALKRGLELLDQVPVGRRFDARAPLGLLQRWYAVQPTQRIIAALLELQQPVSEPQLEAALRKLCALHPHALGVCVVRSTERLSMRALAAADAAPLYRAAEKGDAWSLAEHLLHEPFAAGAPLFRVALLRAPTAVVCTFDHIIFDGIAAGHFACMLARALSGMQLTAAEPDAHLPLDARADLRPSAAQLLKALRAAAPPVAPVPNLESPPVPLRTRVAHYEIASSDTQQLRAAAHRRSLSLHATISACALLAAAEALGGEARRLRLHTPVSLRERCRPQPRGFGVFIGGVDSDLSVLPHSDLWSIAREYADALARDKPGVPGQVGLLAFAGDLAEYARKLDAQHQGRTATLEVSNVGRVLDVPPRTNVWLTQGAHYRGPLFVMTLLESAGVVRICLSTPYPLIDDTHSARLMQAFTAQLAKARR